MHHDQGKIRKELDHIISVGYGIHAVEGRAVEAQFSGSIVPVQRIGGACQGAGAQRTVVHALPAVLQTEQIPAEHLEIGSEMMGQGHRLSLLQMGKAGHEGLRILFHDLQDHSEEIFELAVHQIDLRAGIQPHIQGHLVVAAPPGMEFFAGISDPVDQIGFHEAVDVLVFVGE